MFRLVSGRGGQTAKVTNRPTAQSTSGQEFVPHPEATDLALIVPTFLAPASGLLLLLWPIFNSVFGTQLYTLLEKLQSSC